MEEEIEKLVKDFEHRVTLDSLPKPTVVSDTHHLGLPSAGASASDGNQTVVAEARKEVVLHPENVPNHSSVGQQPDLMEMDVVLPSSPPSPVPSQPGATGSAISRDASGLQPRPDPSTPSTSEAIRSNDASTMDTLIGTPYEARSLARTMRQSRSPLHLGLVMAPYMKRSWRGRRRGGTIRDGPASWQDLSDDE